MEDIYIHLYIKGRLKKKFKGAYTGKAVEGCCFYFRSEELMKQKLICFFPSRCACLLKDNTFLYQLPFAN